MKNKRIRTTKTRKKRSDTPFANKVLKEGQKRPSDVPELTEEEILRQVDEVNKKLDKEASAFNRGR